MKKILITGVSSGIGRELTKHLIRNGDQVWGIARRKKLLIDLKTELGNSNNFRFISLDVTKPNQWRRLISQLKVEKYKPRVVIFNAAILENDLASGSRIDLAVTRRVMETNYYSILSGFNELMSYIPKKAKIILIGSSAAFKGSGEAGIGYSGSKAALSSAFESLYQRFGKNYEFKIIHFGPVKTDMVPFNSKVLFMQTAEKAATVIANAINSTNQIFYSPWFLFFTLRLIKLFPSQAYLSIISLIDSVHQKNRKKLP